MDEPLAGDRISYAIDGDIPVGVMRLKRLEVSRETPPKARSMDNRPRYRRSPALGLEAHRLMEAEMQIRECMTTNVKLINPNMTLREAAGLMRQQDTGFLPVGENDRLIGSLTDRDITVRAVCEGKDPNTATVRETMSEHIVYCFDDQDIAEAANMMNEKQVRRLAVLNHDKRLVGVLSLGDLAERAGDEDAAEHALEGVSRRSGQWGSA